MMGDTYADADGFGQADHGDPLPYSLENERYGERVLCADGWEPDPVQAQAELDAWAEIFANHAAKRRAENPPPAPLCECITKKGDLCRSFAIEDFPYCVGHRKKIAANVDRIVIPLAVI